MRASILLDICLILGGAACAPSERTPASVPAPAPASPVDAHFVDLSDAATSVPVQACRGLYVALVEGTGEAGGHALAVGDLLVQHPAATPVAAVELRGHGVAVVVQGPRVECAAAASAEVIAAAAAPELTFAAGGMHAHLDMVDAPASIYVGRLSGTAGVAEHTHAASWEVLCSVQASGTFTVDGQSQHLGPRSCVAVPPSTRHSWQPDAGSSLVAVQMYSPPGPEQRFKKLAAEGH